MRGETRSVGGIRIDLFGPTESTAMASLSFLDRSSDPFRSVLLRLEVGVSVGRGLRIFFRVLLE